MSERVTVWVSEQTWWPLTDRRMLQWPSASNPAAAAAAWAALAAPSSGAELGATRPDYRSSCLWQTRHLVSSDFAVGFCQIWKYSSNLSGLWANSIFWVVFKGGQHLFNHGFLWKKNKYGETHSLVIKRRVAFLLNSFIGLWAMKVLLQRFVGCKVSATEKLLF